MDFTINKLTYADGLAYRYFVHDEEGELLYVVDRSGMLLPSPTRMVEFFDPERSLVARLQPPDIMPWQRATRYDVIIGPESEGSGEDGDGKADDQGEYGEVEESKPYAVILVKWRLVDLLLLRLPRYTLELGDNRYSARATRYGKTLCQVSTAPEEEPEDEGSSGGENGDEPDGEAEQDKKAEEVEVLPLEELVAADEEPDPDAEEDEPATLASMERPATGASYSVKVDEDLDEAAPLRDDLFGLASLAILIDMELYS